MHAYKHGFVVKSQAELKEMMGPPDSDGCHDRKDVWADSFTSEMWEYCERPFFGEPKVVTDEKGRDISMLYNVWEWNWDTRWVHELKRCTLEMLVNSRVPSGKVYAVCVPSDIFQRIRMRAGLTKDDIDLVAPEVAASLKNITVPGNLFVYHFGGEVDVIEFLGHLWLPNELEVLYVEQN